MVNFLKSTLTLLLLVTVVAGCGFIKNAKSLRVEPGAPGAPGSPGSPVDPTETETETRKLKLAWDANKESIGGYRLHYGTAASNYTDVIEVGISAEYPLANFPEEVLFFAVTAFRGDLESPYSNEVSVDLRQGAVMTLP